MTDARVPDWLRKRAEGRSDHPAVLAGGKIVTYRELDRRAEELCRSLRRRGVGPGDRVAVRLENGLGFVELMYGLMRCGAVLVPLHTRLTAAEVCRQARGCNARFLLSGEPGPSPKRRNGPEILSTAEVLEDSDPSPMRDERERFLRLDAVHCILHTSGSTGASKGVLLTYGNHWWSAVGSAFNLGVHNDDRWLACIPFCHVGGLSILLRSVIYGTTAVIHEKFDAARVNQAVDEDGVTLLSVVATMLQRMLAERGDRPYPPTLRCVLVGGGPVPPGLLEECIRRKIPIAQTYGLTETASQVTTLLPEEAAGRPGSAGKPLLPTEVSIAKDGSGAADDGWGEILVRGPSVSPGYADGRGMLGDDGWLHTGDLGRMDRDGFLYVLGRVDDLIVTGGENVHPAEVEKALRGHPEVEDVCVVGVPDAEWGSAVAAFVCLRPGASVTGNGLREYARGCLAGYKLPKVVWFVEDFPRTAAGKIRRKEVRDVAASLVVRGPGNDGRIPEGPLPPGWKLSSRNDV